jgi:hypothetical protein
VCRRLALHTHTHTRAQHTPAQALAALRTLDDYADARGLPLDMLIG